MVNYNRTWTRGTSNSTYTTRIDTGLPGADAKANITITLTPSIDPSKFFAPVPQEAMLLNLVSPSPFAPNGSVNLNATKRVAFDEDCDFPVLKQLTITSTVPILFKSLVSDYYSGYHPEIKMFGSNLKGGVVKEIGFHNIRDYSFASSHDAELHMEIFKSFTIQIKSDRKLCRLWMFGNFVPEAEAKLLWGY